MVQTGQKLLLKYFKTFRASKSLFKMSSVLTRSCKEKDEDNENIKIHKSCPLSKSFLLLQKGLHFCQQREVFPRAQAKVSARAGDRLQ